MKKIIYSLCLVLPMVACGGGGGTNESPRQPPQIRTDYSNLKESKLEPGPLKQASLADFGELVKNGLRISLRENKNDDYYDSYINVLKLLNLTNLLSQEKIIQKKCAKKKIFLS